MGDIPDTTKTVGAAIVMIALVALVLATVFGFIPHVLDDDATFEPGADGFESGELMTGGDEPAGLEVALTTGTGVVMGANESYIADPTSAETFSEGSWTVAVTAEPDLDINKNATYTIYAADNETVHILYEDGYWTARYADGGQTAYVEANATASESSGGFFGFFEEEEPVKTPLVVEWDEGTGELRLYVAGEHADTSSLTTETVPRGAAISWYGTLDELQIIGDSVGLSGAESYADAPTAPLQPADAAARLQFDDGRETTVYYADGDAEFVGDVAIGAGVSDPALVRGHDYGVGLSPVTVVALDDGRVEGAPIVYVTWSDGPFAGVLYTVQSVGSSALGILVIGLLVLAARTVWREFGSGGF